MGGPNQLIYMQQLLSSLAGNSKIWIEVALFLALFGVLVWRPERIQNLSMFKRAYWFFGCSIIVPAVVFAMTSLMNSGGPGGPFGADIGVFLRLSTAFGPVFLGISIICAIGSMVPSFLPPPISNVSSEE